MDVLGNTGHSECPFLYWFFTLWMGGKGSLSQLIIHKGVCRTALATQGLVIILIKVSFIALQCGRHTPHLKRNKSHVLVQAST